MRNPFYAVFFSVPPRTSNFPPALVIFSSADLENLCACTVRADFNSPSPRTLIRSFLLHSPAFTRTSKLMVFSPSPARSPTFTTEYSVRKMLVKPRLGRRRCKGICPPSKPRIMREPERERCPLCPRPDVLPIPLPIPRPTRFLFEFAFLGARMFERFIRFSLLLRVPSTRYPVVVRLRRTFN